MPPKLIKKTKFLIFLLVLSSCSKLKYLNAFDGLKNKPKKIESTTFRANYRDNSMQEVMAFKRIHFYDQKGRKLKSTEYKSDGSLSSGGWSYSYDQYGNQTQNILYNIDSSINVENNYKYNDFGQQIEKVYISSRRKTTVKYIYDRKNRTRRMTVKKDDGSVTETALQRYDKKWREIESISYDSSNQQKIRIEFFYDEKGNQIQSKWFNSENKIYSSYKSTYNFNNDRILIEHYSISGGIPKLLSESRTDYTYDKKGNCIEETLFSSGRKSWITKYEYNYGW